MYLHVFHRKQAGGKFSEHLSLENFLSRDESRKSYVALEIGHLPRTQRACPRSRKFLRSESDIVVVKRRNIQHIITAWTAPFEIPTTRASMLLTREAGRFSERRTTNQPTNLSKSLEGGTTRLYRSSKVAPAFLSLCLWYYRLNCIFVFIDWTRCSNTHFLYIICGLGNFTYSRCNIIIHIILYTPRCNKRVFSPRAGQEYAV